PFRSRTGPAENLEKPQIDPAARRSLRAVSRLCNSKNFLDRSPAGRGPGRLKPDLVRPARTVLAIAAPIAARMDRYGENGKQDHCDDGRSQRRIFELVQLGLLPTSHT